MNYFITFSLLVLTKILLITDGAVTSNCLFGYNGDNCDECGLVNANHNLKIVGGVEAVAYSWPSVVYINFNYTQLVYMGNGVFKNLTFTIPCAGSIIDRKTILTAAHCIQNSVTYTDLFGIKISIPVNVNSFNPTLGSMYSVYVGLHDKSDLNNLQYPAAKMSVNNVIRVSL